jgi:hypothetical protein
MPLDPAPTGSSPLTCNRSDADNQKVSLGRFIEVAELLDAAFAAPGPAPDYLAHECELAEQALFGLVAQAAWTADSKLAKMFRLTHDRGGAC